MSSDPTEHRDRVEDGWLSIAVKNLRGLQDSGDIEYAAITLLFGKNSSGKTSLLRAPLLLKQAIDSADTNEAILSGAIVDFGSYKEMVYNGELAREVHLSAVFSNDERKLFPASFRRELPSIFIELIREMRIEIKIHWNRRSRFAQYQSITFSNAARNQEVLRFERCSPEQYDLFVNGKKLVRVDGPLSPKGIRYAELAFDDPDRSRKKTVDLSYLVYRLSALLQRNSELLIHIGPLREEPSRSYRTEQIAGAKSTDSAVAVLRSGEGLRDIEHALQNLGMARSISVVTLAPGFVAVALKDPQSGREDNLADVGFGVSQVLPIIATLATARRGTTVLIEQPELHLHPEAQGKLADVLYSFASTRKLRLVIETHSEHILLRFQRRIAEKAMRSDDLALYFVDAGEVTRSAVDIRGQLDTTAIPSGFFEEDWHDLLKLTEAAAKAERDD